MKNALLKTSLREIRNSPARFLSILGIIFLGTAFFVGIGATGPDMITSSDNYYDQQKLADATVISTLGLSTTDLDLIKEDNHVAKAMPEYSVDLNLSDKNQVLRFFGYTAQQDINDYYVVKGRLPKNSGEIALDNLADYNKDYRIGDKFIVAIDDDPKQQLKKREFKVVGFVNSPEYIENIKRGSTNVGSGTIDYFAVVHENDLNLPSYSRILVQFKESKKHTAYSKTYEKITDEGIKSLRRKLRQRPQQRLKEVKEQAQEQLKIVQAEITQGEKTLDDGENKLKRAKEKIENAKKELAAKIESGKKEQENIANKLEEQEKELQQQNEDLNQQGQLLAQEQAEVAAQRKAATTTSTANPNDLAIQQTQEKIDNGNNLKDKLEQLSSDEETLKKEISEEKSSLLALAELIGDAQLNESIEKWDEENITLADVVAVQKEIINRIDTLKRQLTQLTNTETTSTLDLSEIEEKERSLAQAEVKLDQAKKTLQDKAAELKEAKAKLIETKEKADVTTKKAETEIAGSEKVYQQQLIEFQKQTSTNMPKLLDAELQLKNEKKRLENLKPAEYIFSDRNDNPGYTEYKQNADRITSLATVFPLIFYLIAALVSLTTMTRMVEEKRGEIGTFKALGYRNAEIALKFFIYSFLAGIIGSLLGLLVGFNLFPSIIIDAYGQLYNLPSFVTPWYLNYTIIGIMVGLICTVGVAMLTVRLDLIVPPATLLRPKAPKAGKRVWLENIKPLWKRLNFNQKVTLRNLFRYKLRMLMTVVGIAGCTAMIVTGFGLRDSITDIIPLQFEKLWHYQAVVSFSDTNKNNETRYEREVKQLNRYKDSLAVSIETFTISGHDKTPQDVSVYVPQKAQNLNEFILLNNRQSTREYQLQNKGAVINEKLAQLFNIKIGDTIHLKDTDKQSYPIKVAGIAENYTGHFAYLSPSYYEQVFQRKPEYNAAFLLFKKDLSSSQEKDVAEKLMENPEVVNVSFLSDSLHALDDTTQALTIVVWVLIISAGLLAFIVLYNLNNINISERIRELSTIKVLGFYDNELTMYIYRENIILTIFGILFGLVLGKIEHDFVLKTVELDMVMFSPVIQPLSYLYASLITIFFTILVGIFIYIKLKNVDMIEALKSNE
ncbi:ABC transporter permease [Enterococcus saigonensis]|uniref:ABC transporter permease n=1 Tax=Enterococcus saigonensis TaxID=1805431 RepID=A0A679ICQ6_9ENTE|nr:FtsX-like permease family protein [Enterococcus saigonensis]BCA86013.1 ABC transporter permease [Enterococcus saigonensis]